LPEIKKTPPRLVEKRRVVHISGFEPIGPEGLDRRMKSGLRRFGELWSASAVSAPPMASKDGRAVVWDVEAKGPNWQTETRYTVLRWDDQMAPYVGQPWAKRVLSGYKALVEFARTGTIGRYFRANVRYGLFVIYPLLTLVGFLLLAIGVGVVVGLSAVPLAPVLGLVGGLATFLVLLRFLGSYFYLDFALADWAFAADLARRDIPGLEDCLQRFAGEVREAMRDPDADEVLLSGVSLGAVMLVEALARAYSSDPELAGVAGKAAFLTVGSSILKIGLHPAATGLRRDVERIGNEGSLLWVEYQAKVDPINFYKTDPVADLGMQATGRPVVKQIRIRDMMSAEGYRKAQRSSLLLHRQFVMPNARRYFYDFYQIGFGPLPLARRLALGQKATGAFGDDGSYLAGEARAPRAAITAARR
jgi:hypothetical protein